MPDSTAESHPPRGAVGPGSADLARLQRVAWWLDSALEIPGTSIRVGVDSLVGLIPGIGDVVGVALSSYLIREGVQRGLPRRSIGRMVGNVALESIVGIVPVVGDVFDVAWRANQRNVGILLEAEHDRFASRTAGEPRGSLGWTSWLALGGASLAGLGVAALFWQKLG